MKKIEKSSELLWVLGTLFVALGVTFCSKADLGLSMIAAPAFVIFEFIEPLWSGFSVGMTDYLFQGLILVLLCIVVRRFNWRYLLAFLVAVIYGNVLNLFMFLFRDLTVDTAVLRWLMMLLGDAITALGVACYFRTYLPLQVYELFVAELSARFKLNINKTKWGFDITLLLISLTLALVLFGDIKSFEWSKIGTQSFHNIGLGTIVTTIINSPLIAMFGKLIDKFFAPTPCFPKMYKILKRN